VQYAPDSPVSLTDAPIRTPNRISLLLAIPRYAGGQLLALDSDRNELVRLAVPGFADGPSGDQNLIAIALSHDGKCLVVAPDVHSEIEPGVGVYVFGADHIRWHRLSRGGLGSHAAFSPDDGTLAVFANVTSAAGSTGHRSRILLLEPDTGSMRPIFELLSSMVFQESAIGWSADAGHLAATMQCFVEGEGYYDSTVVLSYHGTVVHKFDDMRLMGRHPNAWINNHQFVAQNSRIGQPPISVVDLDGTVSNIDDGARFGEVGGFTHLDAETMGEWRLRLGGPYLRNSRVLLTVAGFPFIERILLSNHALI
jgi:hypothetical protein